MTLVKHFFAAAILFGSAAVSIAEVPPLSPQMLEAMPFKFKATVRSVVARVVSSTDCRIETKFDVSLEKVESLRNANLPRVVKFEGTGYKYINLCIGGTGAMKALAKLRVGDEIVVFSEAPDANGTYHINHYSQLELKPR